MCFKLLWTISTVLCSFILKRYKFLNLPLIKQTWVGMMRAISCSHTHTPHTRTLFINRVALDRIMLLNSRNLSVPTSIR